MTPTDCTPTLAAQIEALIEPTARALYCAENGMVECPENQAHLNYWFNHPDPSDTGMVDEYRDTARLILPAIVTALRQTEAAPGVVEAEDFLTQLRRVNTERYQAWIGDGEDAGILFDAAELGGEVGELLNVVKKLEREERGWRGSRAAPEDFADECADVLICLDKLARRKGVDLVAATVAKFNATSDKVGLPQRLALARQHGTREPGRPIGTEPPACSVLGGRFNESWGWWTFAVVNTPMVQPFTHWWQLPGFDDAEIVLLPAAPATDVGEG